jgi:hypothetical protein
MIRRPAARASGVDSLKIFEIFDFNGSISRAEENSRGLTSMRFPSIEHQLIGL